MGSLLGDGVVFGVGVGVQVGGVGGFEDGVGGDELGGGRVSDAEVAETGYAAFTSKKKEIQVTARLIVRRVRALNKKAAEGQGELFPAWRYHAILTDSPFVTLQSEDQHRGHAIVEQVFADWNDGPLAHMPSVISSPDLGAVAVAAAGVCVLFPARRTHYLNSVSVAEPVQIPSSLMFLELGSYYVNAVRLHVYAADALVRRCVDRGDLR